jgi:hypothetical protein
MRIYAVYLPSGLSMERASERAELVRQGFNWSAFFVTPVWALRHGHWLALALWFAWVLGVMATSWLANLETDAALALYSLGALAFGLEADRFRQARLTRKGFLMHGLTLGDSLGEAEILYFRRHPAMPEPAPARSETLSAPVARTEQPVAWTDSTGGPDLLGLFAPPENKR